MCEWGPGFLAGDYVRCVWAVGLGRAETGKAH